MYGLYGLKHHIVEISGDVTDPDGRTDEQTTRKDRATQLLICEALSFAIWTFLTILTILDNLDISSDLDNRKENSGDIRLKFMTIFEKLISKSDTGQHS